MVQWKQNYLYLESSEYYINGCCKKYKTMSTYEEPVCKRHNSPVDHFVDNF